MKQKHFKKLIIITALVCIFTRFWGLDRVPPHLSNDEISIAYDAYSILKTLRDEHNHYLPLSFESHGTYKAPLAIYLTSLSVMIFGNSDFSARFPSALLGCLTVLFLGLLVYELTKNKYHALLSSFILAITPWHTYTSRMLLETNIALFFLVGGIYLFFYSINRKGRYTFILSFLFFALSMYGYHTEWGLTPLIIITLSFIYFKNIKNKIIFFAGLFVFGILVLPLLADFVSNLGTNARANTQFLLTQESLRKQLSEYQENYIRSGQIILSRFVATYSSYIEPDKIFFASPNLLPLENPFQSGLILAPLLLMFFYGLYKSKSVYKDNAKFVVVWLLISPIVPALTVGEQMVVRNLPFVLPLVVIISAGFYKFVINYQEKTLLYIGYIILVIISFFYFIVIYYYHYPKLMAIKFQYGYEQIAKFIKPKYDSYEKIIIDPIFGEGYVYTGVPHLYIPYYTNLDPRFLQVRGRNEKCGNCFAKYEIRSIEWIHEKVLDKSLYVVPNSNKPSDSTNTNLKPIAEIFLPDGSPAFVIYESNGKMKN